MPRLRRPGPQGVPPGSRPADRGRQREGVVGHGADGDRACRGLPLGDGAGGGSAPWSGAPRPERWSISGACSRRRWLSAGSTGGCSPAMFLHYRLLPHRAERADALPDRRAGGDRLRTRPVPRDLPAGRIGGERRHLRVRAAARHGERRRIGRGVRRAGRGARIRLPAAPFGDRQGHGLVGVADPADQPAVRPAQQLDRVGRPPRRVRRRHRLRGAPRRGRVPSGSLAPAAGSRWSGRSGSAWRSLSGGRRRCRRSSVSSAGPHGASAMP